MFSPSPRRPFIALLLLLPLSACAGDDGGATTVGESSSDASSTAGASTSTSTPTGASATETTTADATAGTGSGASGSSATGDGTSGSTGTFEGDPCEAYCQVLVECTENDPEGCVESCEFQLDLYGEIGTCGPNYEALLVCTGGLDCEEFAAHQQGIFQELDDYPCKDEFDASGVFDAPCLSEEPSASCVAYCGLATTCFEDYTEHECLGDCAFDRAVSELVGEPGCLEAFDGLYTCLSDTADCGEIQEPAVCAEEFGQVDLLCPFNE